MAAESHRNARAALDRAAPDGAARARADHRLHRHPHLMTHSSRPHRRPAGPPRALRGRAAAGRPGGPRAPDRHGGGDRRPLRRQPRHLRDRRRAALAARLADATRSSGTSATRPTRTRSSPAAATSSPTIRQYGGLAPFCAILESEHDIMGAGHASTSIGYAVGLKEAMRRGGADGRQGRRGHRRRRDDRRRRLRGDPPGRRPRHADGRRSSTTTACRSRRTSARCRATSTASASTRSCGRRARASRSS